MITSLNHPKLPRYEQIRQEIQERLAKGQWHIGQPIPSEQELAQEFGVSVGTVRKAIEQFVEGGLLVKIQGKGTFVRQPDFSSSLCRFFRHRQKGGQNVIPVGKVLAVNQIKGQAHINQWFDCDENETQIHIERTRQIDNKIIISEQIWLPYQRFFNLVNTPKEQYGNLLYPFYMEQCGCLIVSVKEELTFVAKFSDTHLVINNAPAIKIRRWAYDANGQIVEYRESFGRAEDFCYETIIN